MCNGKPVYKLIDGKGRVLIPKELRSAAGMDYGDIVRLGVASGRVSIRKVDIIEVGDQSPDAVEAYVRAAFKAMPDDTRLSLITALTELLRQKKQEV
jgi:bifunctional DNA-binding transcriptional regulator/antitoxin component of YhaV-PrlF toxin-antitoxin module